MKQQRDLFKILRLGLIVCPIEDVPIPLNCCKVSADIYKVLQGKYKMKQILKNVFPG
jgi:hypothetical protein